MENPAQCVEGGGFVMGAREGHCRQGLIVSPGLLCFFFSHVCSGPISRIGFFRAHHFWKGTNKRSIRLTFYLSVQPESAPETLCSLVLTLFPLLERINPKYVFTDHHGATCQPPSGIFSQGWGLLCAAQVVLGGSSHPSSAQWIFALSAEIKSSI